jgi:hypothetical protein
MVKRGTKKRNTKKRNTKKRLQRGGTNENLYNQIYSNNPNKANNTDNYWREKIREITGKRYGRTNNKLTEYDMKRKNIKTYEEYYNRLIQEYEEADRNSEILRGYSEASSHLPPTQP